MFTYVGKGHPWVNYLNKHHKGVSPAYKLQERQHLGHGLRDELMYEVIDKLLARELKSPKPKTRQSLKKETLEKVLQSWQDAGLLDNYMDKS